MALAALESGDVLTVHDILHRAGLTGEDEYGLTARHSDYASMLTIWESTVRTSPRNPRAQYDLGVSLEAEGQIQTAIAHYDAAVQLNPTYFEALNNLGHALLKAGRPADSVTYLRRAIAIKASLAETHTSLATALAQTGKLQEAEQEFAQALRL